MDLGCVAAGSVVPVAMVDIAFVAGIDLTVERCTVPVVEC